MPATFVIDHDQRMVLSRAWGVLVDDDLRGTQQALRSDDRFESTYCQLYDFSEVTEVKLTGHGIQSLAYTSPFAVDARRAVVVSSDVAFGMARMYALIGNRDERVFRIFRDRQSAMAWLQIPFDRTTAPTDSPDQKEAPPLAD